MKKNIINIYIGKDPAFEWIEGYVREDGFIIYIHTLVAEEDLPF
jgi:hypothetical protein